ncbi:MAG TPA: glycosyltransferase [Sphingomonas sp.]|nr:glycosyltransferase [Sphingomonas sp.]
MTKSSPLSAQVGVVVIGRNEGDRLKACLRSIPPGSHVIYVDSGSTDDSVAFAESLGFTAVQLDTSRGFTAARARNAGLAALAGHDLAFVQMVDGDCALDVGWIDAALAAFVDEPDLAVVFGRRRERFPDRSIYNRLCDEEWDVPVGEARSCGGDALFRLAALKIVGGYNGDIIAGEEPDLCLRLRQMGWRIRRIDAEMTLHDAAMTHLSQYWRRSKRSGHAFAELLQRHGAAAEPRWQAQVNSIVLWGGIVPALIVALALGAFFLPILGWAALTLAALYPVQIGRIGWRKHRAGAPLGFAFASAFFLMLGKLAQLTGVIRYRRNRASARAPTIIEYKGAGQG